MAEEFGGDLADAVFWGADMRRATFRDIDFTGTSISHALVVDVSIDAYVERLVVNGVDVTDFVNERDRWYPLRAMLRPTTPEAARETWVALDAAWADALAIADALPPEAVHEAVDGEFSLVETFRHLVFAMDKWFTVPVTGGEFHPYGLPNRGSLDFGWPGLDLHARPSLDEVLAARRDRAERFADHLEHATSADLATTVEVMENGTVTLDECWFTVFEEEFWHLRYATRDLATLASRADGTES